MNGRWLFCLTVLGAAALARAQTSRLDAFESLKPGDIAGEQAAVTKLLAQTDDPAILLSAAQIARAKYVDGPVNTLEYWSSDAQAEEQLRASADAVLRLIDSAEMNARRLAGNAAAAMHNANDAATMERWKDSTQLVTAAEREEVNAEYARLLAAEPEEKKVCEERALTAAKAVWLSEPRTAASRLEMAKIWLAGADAAEAKVELAKLIGESSGDVAEQFQEHYFYCVCDLVTGDNAKAETDLADLKQWQARTLVGANALFANPGAAAAGILEYRIDLARAEKAEGRKQKILLESSAIGVLENLVHQQPGLKAAALAHLGERFGGRADHSHVEPLVLEAIMQNGTAADAGAQAVAEAKWAAETVVKRSGEFDSATVDYAAALSAAILDRNGQTRAAADAYLALAKRLENRNRDTAAAALDRAIELFRQLPDQSGDASYAQALAMAMAKPFDRKNLGYAYGQTLVEQKNYRGALAVFREIGADDPHYRDTELAEMVCIQRLMQGESGPERIASATQVAELEKDILRQRAGPSLAAVSAIFICAEVDQSLDEPEMMLQQLRELPARSRGLAQQRELLERGDELRVAALVQLDRPTEAVEIVAGSTGQIDVPVAALAKALETDFDKTQNSATRLQIAQARLRLGAWLMNHAAGQNEDQRSRYQLYYADSLRRAGELEKNEATRQADLHQALDLFQQLAAGHSGDASDLTPLLGQAGVQFDLGNYPAVHEILFPLLNAGRFGDGQGQTADMYWEATYELLASNAALADSGQADSDERAETIAYLKRLYIQWGDQIGGKRWHASFEILRRRLAPGFTPPSPTPPASP